MERDLKTSRQRQYRRALVELKRDIELELAHMDKDEEENKVFEPSNGITAACNEVVKANYKLVGIVEMVQEYEDEQRIKN